MRVLIDIGHPAHVHYFKYFALEFEKRGNKILFAARDRGEIFELLDSYGFQYFNRGKGFDNIFLKATNLLYVNILILVKSLKFKPDIFLGFGSPYLAQVSKILFKPCILFDDTEFSSINISMYRPFVDVIFTPRIFSKEIGKKQIRFSSLMELSYLHPNKFKSEVDIFNLLNLKAKTKYVIIRFVAFKAIHDIGAVGFTKKKKIELVNKLQRYAKVFIRFEGELPKELENYRLNIEPKYLHDIIANASLYIGDSQTTTTEACCLGIPSIRCNTFAKSKYERANFIYLEEKRLLFNFNEKEVNQAINKALSLIKLNNLRIKWKENWNIFIRENIDTTSFLLWVIENYPKSIEILKRDPKYQERFK